MNKVVLKRLEQLVVLGMVLGTIGMFQPWNLDLYQYGFALLALSTLGFIIVSHVPAREA
jgi:hypothetical protein